jgi:5-methylcytosine-specific restriction endonuclease McrBC GTP-binding regulatory subunit McrB
LPEEGKVQAEEIVKTFRALYPIYLFAVSNNPIEMIEEIDLADEADEEILPIDSMVEKITFHQSYSYEEFMEGIRPVVDNSNDNLRYIIQPGIFKDICARARNDPKNNYFLLIDEINRGNISRIFGELITLIEMDKRMGPNNRTQPNTIEVTLPYSKNQGKFSVPFNLFIVGTMNTADKSIALVDVALRRRFAFLEMLPDSSKVTPISINGTEINLPKILDTMNQKIAIMFDKDHQIGHSYLMNIDEEDIQSLKFAFYHEIIPLVQEYFYNDWEKISTILGGFVKEILDENSAQAITDNATNGISEILELDDEKFIQVLTKLASVGKQDETTD